MANVDSMTAKFSDVLTCNSQPMNEKMRLTDEICNSAKVFDRKFEKLFDGRGMYLEVWANGAKYWRIKYRFGGKENRLSLGVYPEISIENARAQVGKIRKMLRDGMDPSLARKNKKITQNMLKPSAPDSYASTVNRLKEDVARLLDEVHFLGLDIH